MKKIELHCQDNGSDKVYQVEIQLAGNDLYVVNFAYGRRGSNLNIGTKTTTPVSYQAAEKIFDKLVAEKKRGKTGVSIYREVSSSSSSAAPIPSIPAPSANTNNNSGISIQLLNPITSEQLETYLEDENFGVMEKHDGERRLMHVSDNKTVSGINRNSLFRSLPQELADEYIQLCNGRGEYIFDGEIIGENHYVFDVLMIDGVDCRSKSFLMRYELLKSLFQSSGGNLQYIHLSELAVGESDKRLLCEKIRNEQREGFVIKSLTAPYTGGRPNSGGDALKYKLVEDATCRVGSHHPSKRSVGLQVLDSDNNLIDVGNCTIPVNHNIPNVGEMVDIRYLYAFPNGGSLYQPVYKGLRTDKTTADLHSSLKFKQAIAA